MKLQLIDLIEKKIEKQSITTSKVIGTSEFPFLSHHSFGNHIIIPAVFFLEQFAQTANALFNAYKLSVINKIEFKSFLTLSSNKKITLYCSINTVETLAHSVNITGEIYYYFQNKALKIKRPKVIAVMEAQLTTNLNGNKKRLTFPFYPTSDLIIEKSEIYPELVGLGESFNHLDSIMQISSDKGAIGNLIKNNNTISCNELLLGDLFIRDSSYHLASVWGNHFIGGFNVPSAMYDIHFYQKLKDTDNYYCIAKPLGQNELGSLYNLLIINSNFDVVEKYEKILYTHDVKIDRPVSPKKINDRLEKINRFEQLTAKLNKKLSHFGIWHVSFVKKNLALFEKYLNTDELKIYNKLVREKSKLEFLGGRISLKSLIIKALEENYNKLPDLNSITIKRENHLPVLYVENKKYDMIQFSISHKDYIFTAINLNSKIGIDVEKISNKLLKIKSKYIDQREELILSNENKENLLLDKESYCKLWSSKESLIKLLGNVTLLETMSKAKLTSINKNEYHINIKSNSFKSSNYCYLNYVFSVIISDNCYNYT